MKLLEAMQLGLKSYQPDKPCFRGHTSKRYTLNNACFDCIKFRRERDKSKTFLKLANDIRTTALLTYNARIKAAQVQYELQIKKAEQIERKYYGT